MVVVYWCGALLWCCNQMVLHIDMVLPWGTATKWYTPVMLQCMMSLLMVYAGDLDNGTTIWRCSLLVHAHWHCSFI
jgi:hypothetical protein